MGIPPSGGLYIASCSSRPSAATLSAVGFANRYQYRCPPPARVIALVAIAVAECRPFRIRLTRLALQLSPYVFVRTGELSHAEWSEIDLEVALWTIPAEKMKMRKPHHVPLHDRVAAGGGAVARCAGSDWPHRLRIPFHPHPRPAHERGHSQRSIAAHGLSAPLCPRKQRDDDAPVNECSTSQT